MSNFADFIRFCETARFVEATQWLHALEEPVKLREEESAYLRSLVFHDNTELRQACVCTLGMAGDIQSVKSLAELCALGKNGYDHDYIYDAFRDMGEAAVPNLVEVASNSEEDVRHAALWGLGLIGGEAVSPLIGFIDAGVDDAVRALCNVRDPRLVETLIRVISTREGELAEGAAYTLTNCCDPSCSETAPQLARLLHGTNAVTRGYILEALGKLGNTSVLPQIVRTLHRGGSTVPEAAQALLEFGTEESLTELVTAMRHPKISDQRLPSVLTAILDHPLSGEAQLAEVTSLAFSKVTARQPMTDLFRRIGEEETYADLVCDYSDSKDPMVNLALALVYAGTEPARASTHFKVACYHGNDHERAICAELISELGNEDDLRVLSKDRTWGVRLAIARELLFAFEGLSPANEDSIGIDLELLKSMKCDPSRRVRSAALNSLAYRQRKCGEETVILETLGPFLFDHRGAPTDYVTGEIHHFDGTKSYTTLSDDIKELQIPEAAALISSWESAGGSRAVYDWPESGWD